MIRRKLIRIVRYIFNVNISITLGEIYNYSTYLRMPEIYLIRSTDIWIIKAEIIAAICCKKAILVLTFVHHQPLYTEKYQPLLGTQCCSLSNEKTY